MAVVETFLKRSSIFSSVEEFNRYKKIWPSRTVVEAFVKKHVNSVHGHPYQLGLDISSRSTGICVLSDQGRIRWVCQLKVRSSRVRQLNQTIPVKEAAFFQQMLFYRPFSQPSI